MISIVELKNRLGARVHVYDHSKECIGVIIVHKDGSGLEKLKKRVSNFFRVGEKKGDILYLEVDERERFIMKHNEDNSENLAIIESQLSTKINGANAQGFHCVGKLSA